MIPTTIRNLQRLIWDTTLLSRPPLAGATQVLRCSGGASSRRFVVFNDGSPIDCVPSPYPVGHHKREVGQLGFGTKEVVADFLRLDPDQIR